MDQVMTFIHRILEGPTALYLGTRDENNQVFSTCVHSMIAEDQPNKLVLYIPELLLTVARRNLQISNYVAVLAINSRTYEGVQVKGKATIRKATEMELTYSIYKLNEVSQFYGDYGLLDRIATEQLMAVEVEVTEVYNQTPGNGAGELV